MTPEELAAHETRHQPASRGAYAVCRTCEGLWPCASQRASSALREARAEVETLCDDMAHQVRRHGEAIARAEKAEAAIARVRAVCDAEWDWKAGRSLHAALRAALDGEA